MTKYKFTSKAYAMAPTIGVELPADDKLLSKSAVEDIIRSAADTRGMGKRLDVEKTFQDLKRSGFIVSVEGL